MSGLSIERVGDVLREQGDQARALEAYRKGLAISEQLAAQDRSNATAQRDLVASCWALHAVSKEMGEARAAKEYLERGIAILGRLRGEGKWSPKLDGWLRTFEHALAKIE